MECAAHGALCRARGHDNPRELVIEDMPLLKLSSEHPRHLCPSRLGAQVLLMPKSESRRKTMKRLTLIRGSIVAGCVWMLASLIAPQIVQAGAWQATVGAQSADLGRQDRKSVV